ncbi:MAG: hypothetical protein K2X38_18895 [Gemmataceae bacterium]|nr:hypothetical protein [Gemmataceae bacterium]
MRTERKTSRKELPTGWIAQAVALADGRMWTASFCPECQKDLEKSLNRARASVDE